MTIIIYTLSFIIIFYYLCTISLLYTFSEPSAKDKRTLSEGLRPGSHRAAAAEYVAKVKECATHSEG